MSDTFVGPKIEQEPGGDVLRVKSGGSVTIDDGGGLTGTRIQRKLVTRVLSSATALTTLVPDHTVVTTELPITVKKVALMLNSALAGHATSNAVSNLYLLSALATATTQIASKTFTTTNAVAAYVPATITLTTSVAVAAGESLIHRYTFASSGQDVPIGHLTVEFVVDAT